MYLKLYRWLTTLIGPIIDLWLIYRRRKGKEDHKRFPERLGHPGFPRPKGSLVWFHAASVGEATSILPLIEHMIKQYSDVNILITTGTVTSAKMLKPRLPERVIHQYVPIDKMVTVRRFLAHWHPNLALWVESELWPNLVIETQKSGCPMIQINARISANSVQKWQRYGNFSHDVLGCFSLSLSQSKEDQERLELLGAPHVKCLGNLKFDAPALPADPKETGRLVTMIGDRPIWVASSTHPGEETIISNVHCALKENHDRLLTIIIPRHPERGEALQSEFRNKGLSVALRSMKQEIGQETDIYIADTIGELGIFFRLAGIVFIGGSLVEHGGQNPLEPARLECALITGPWHTNFMRIYKELKDAEAVRIVQNEKDLLSQVETLLTDHDIQEKLAATSLQLMESKGGVLSAYIEEITPYLKPLTRQEPNNENA